MLQRLAGAGSPGGLRTSLGVSDLDVSDPPGKVEVAQRHCGDEVAGTQAEHLGVAAERVLRRRDSLLSAEVVAELLKWIGVK